MKTALFIILLFAVSQSQQSASDYKAIEDSLINLKKAKNNPPVDIPIQAVLIVPVKHQYTYQITSNDQVDSLQSILDGITLRNYADKIYKKSVDYTHEDKLSYYRHLIKYNIKDTASIINHAQCLLETYDLQTKIYKSLISEEYSNANGTILAYIKNMRKKMIELTAFIVSISNDDVSVNGTKLK